MKIIPFLNARYDEAEALAAATEPDHDAEPEEWINAREARSRQLHTSQCGYRVGNGLDDDCECGTPARTLADLAAKRMIADLHDVQHICPGPGPFTADPDIEAAGDAGEYGGPCATLLALAAEHADHEDFHPRWKIDLTPET